MAFLRTARANEVRFGISEDIWQRVRVASAVGTLSPNLVEQASDILGEHLTPDRYLLSHATIVCSCDTEEPPNVRLGKLTVDGNRINRKYGDYRITKDTEKFGNNNNDGWERKLLLKSYRTFVGADNFVEHVQLPEHNKGRIIDAVARDIGPSIYVDILLATDRKHRELIANIEKRKIATLSMGCYIDFSVCSRCGHVSTDETNMCRHIRYEKGNQYVDDMGTLRRTIELCGHHSVDPTGGNRFIEASWVEVPAFKGAVMRNILQPQDVSPELYRRARQILAMPPKQWNPDNLQGIIKAASLVLAVKERSRAAGRFDFDEPDEDEEGAEPAGEQVGPIETAIDELVEWMGNEAQRKLKEKMKPAPSEPSTFEEPLSPNESLIHEGRARRDATATNVYHGGLQRLASIARSDGQLMNGIKRFNEAFGVKVPDYIYKTALRVGASTRYRNVQHFNQACARVMQRKPNLGEAKTLIRLGKLLSQRVDH